MSVRMLIAIAATSCAAEMSLPDRVARGEVRGPVEVIGEPGANVLVPPMQRGRVWIAPGGSPIVFELVSNGHPIGVVAELWHGTVTAMRVYADSTQGHPISRTPFAGTAIATAHGTAAEAALVATANESWAGMNAHSAARTLASAAPEYTLEDFSAPTVLDRAGTEAMVDRFLGFVGEFQIVAMPVQFAAGDDVITEMVEHMTLQGTPITLHGLDIKHVVGGRVVKEWQYANGAEIQRALLATDGR